MVTDTESAAYNIAWMLGAPWRVNVVRQLGIIKQFYSLKF
jgi:hypothetical protein